MTPPFLVHHFLERGAAQHPDRTFIVHLKDKVSYAQAEAQANRIARLLLHEGLRRGDRVGVLLENSPLYVHVYFGILKAGGIAVPLNTAASPGALVGTLGDCGARALVFSPRQLRLADQMVSELSGLDLLVGSHFDRLKNPPENTRCIPLEEAMADQSANPPALPIVDLDIASIIYTSGSTGKARGATLSHRNLVTNTQSILSYLELRPTDRTLCILPFFYVYGKSLLNTHAAAGATLVLENRFLYPNTALDTLEAEECTGISGVPSTFSILLNRSTFPTRTFPHLRYITQAGGPMSPELTLRLVEQLPEVKLFVMYGATEASARLSYLPPEDLAEKVGSIGKAIPNVSLRILRKDGSEADVDEVGEIVARGSNIMQGYWGDPEETASVLDEGGAYHTGDLGRRDADGFLYVVGRTKDMIKAGGHRISAKEIEEVILAFPDIHEVAVIGAPDEILGEKIVAYVAFQRETEEVDPLIKFLKQRLPAFKQPSEFEVRKELPKSAAGKISKPQLREEYAQRIS